MFNLIAFSGFSKSFELNARMESYRETPRFPPSTLLNTVDATEGDLQLIYN